MIFDLQTRTLFTDEGVLLKHLNCPLRKQWEELHPTGSNGARHCADCVRQVHDTAQFSDAQLQALLAAEPGACLTVSLGQANVRVVLAR